MLIQYKAGGSHRAGYHFASSPLLSCVSRVPEGIETGGESALADSEPVSTLTHMIECGRANGPGPANLHRSNIMAEQAQVNPNWEPRYQKIRENLYIPIGTKFLAQMVAAGMLSEDEANRSRWKIKLIEPFVTRMVANMVKGSLKYTTDDWLSETWQDMGLDDADMEFKADGINYGLLFEDYRRKEGLI